jgi:RimJ/RimL family protein N-acetyltransferase
LDATEHPADLFALSHADESAQRIWDYLSYGPFPDLASFTTWFAARAESSDPLFFAARHKASGQVQGMMSYLNIYPANGSIEIGHIWLTPPMQNSRHGTEALYLLMAHAFNSLHYRRLEWKCNALNEGSRRAALRLGFAFEGIFYQHMVSKGRNRDTAWFSLLDYEWPLVQANFQTWLVDANFDAEGKPRQSLGALNGALRPH